MTIRIRLLGTLEMARGDAEAKLPARKTEALLALLALRPGVAFGREWLSALLWPDVPEAQARTSLRQAVGHLRKAFGERFVVSSAEKVHLDPSLVWTDTAELERTLARPPREREPVVDLWRGTLLEGFPAIEQPFVDWLSEKRARLTERVALRLEECLAGLSAAEDTERALAVGTRLLQLEPTRESAHRALMRLHEKRGDRAAALRQYERCRDLLRRHFDIRPSAQTEKLRGSLLEAAAPSAETPSPRLVAADPPKGRVPLAILAFESVEGATQLLARGLTEDVTTELSRFRELAVLAPGTVMELAGQPESAEVIGERTGARLVLSGSVRAASGRVRITAALTDATTGLELWRERWDTGFDDAFGVLDRLTRSVVGALSLRIDEARLGAARERPRERLEVYECWLRGLECLRRGTPASDDEAREFFQRSLVLSPTFARGYAGVSLSHFNDWSCQAWDRWDERERLSFENARRAVELDDSDHVTHTILARIYVYRRQFEMGERHLEHALRLNTNDPNMLMHAAIAFSQLGEPRRASELADDALRLNPTSPDWYYAVAAFTRFVSQEPDEAIRLALRAPDSMVDTRALLAAACAYRGEGEAAREHARRFIVHIREKIVRGRELEPDEPLRWLLRVSPFRRAADTEYLLDGLARAGLESKSFESSSRAP